MIQKFCPSKLNSKCDFATVRQTFLHWSVLEWLVNTVYCPDGSAFEADLVRSVFQAIFQSSNDNPIFLLSKPSKHSMIVCHWVAPSCSRNVGKCLSKVVIFFEIGNDSPSTWSTAGKVCRFRLSAGMCVIPNLLGTAFTGNAFGKSCCRREALPAFSDCWRLFSTVT